MPNRYSQSIQILFTAVFILLLTACTEAEPVPEAGNFSGGEGETAAVPEPSRATVDLSVIRGGPNTPVTVSGQGFAPNRLVTVLLGTSNDRLRTPYAQTSTDDVGGFALDVVMPTLWQDTLGGEEAIFVSVDDGSQIAETVFVQQYTDAWQTYENRTAGIGLQIPAAWTVTEPQVTPLGELTMMGLPPVEAGDPAVSMVLVADDLRRDEALSLLQCGTRDCLGRVAFSIDELNGVEVRRTQVGTADTAGLTWFFVPVGDKLVYFTLHDPTTLEAIRPLAETLTIAAEVVAQAPPTPTAVPVDVTATPTPAPTATMVSPINPDTLVWTETEIADAGLRVDLPVGGTLDETGWTAGEEQPLNGRVGVRWLAVDADEPWESNVFFPADAEVTARLAVTLAWAEGAEYRLVTEDTAEIHVVVRTDERAYDFFARADSESAVEALLPVLQNMVATAQTYDVDARPSPTPTVVPTEAPVPTATPDYSTLRPWETVNQLLLFFVRDNVNADTVGFFSEAVRADFTGVESVPAALDLGGQPSDFFVERQIDDAGRVVVRADLSGAGGYEETRYFVLVEEGGRWRVNRVTAEYP